METGNHSYLIALSQAYKQFWDVKVFCDKAIDYDDKGNPIRCNKQAHYMYLCENPINFHIGYRCKDSEIEEFHECSSGGSTGGYIQHVVNPLGYSVGLKKDESNEEVVINGLVATILKFTTHDIKCFKCDEKAEYLFVCSGELITTSGVCTKHADVEDGGVCKCHNDHFVEMIDKSGKVIDPYQFAKDSDRED